MKPVYFIKKYRFTKQEVIEALLLHFFGVTTEKELNRLVKRDHVVEYGEEYMDAINEYGCSDTTNDPISDHMQGVVYNIGTELGLTDREAPEAFIIKKQANEDDAVYLAVKGVSSCIDHQTGNLTTDVLGDLHKARRLLKKKTTDL